MFHVKHLDAANCVFHVKHADCQDRETLLNPFHVKQQPIFRTLDVGVWECWTTAFASLWESAGTGLPKGEVRNAWMIDLLRVAPFLAFQSNPAFPSSTLPFRNLLQRIDDQAAEQFRVEICALGGHAFAVLAYRADVIECGRHD